MAFTIRSVPTAPLFLTERFRRAVALAQAIHWRQQRPATKAPYLAHLLVVTGLVIEDGGDEDQAIAAMLHDSVEGGGGRLMLQRIARTFGLRVAEIVQGCSDTVDGPPIGPWIERKRRYLAHLEVVEDDAILRVALADKLHNARSIVRHCREDDSLCGRFHDRTPSEQVWYYDRLVELFERRRPGPLTEDLRRAVAELARMVSRDEEAEGALSFAPTLRRRPAPVSRLVSANRTEGRQRQHRA